jgi:hypothetical protein
MLRHRIVLRKTSASAFLMLFFGCATVMQPGPDSIPLTSVPPGATVLLNGYIKGVTPVNVVVNHDERCSLEIHKDGYQTIYINKDKVVAGWVFGNIVFGGVPGLIVDLAMHNQGKYSEDPMTVILQPLKSTKAKKL